MARINNTTTFPITTPAAADMLIGTDVSDTTNSADGETVNFTAGSIADLAFTTGWHPYNKTSVEDTDDGLIYSFAVDGAVSQITTPDFSLGYEYAVFLDAIEGPGGFGNHEIQMRMYMDGVGYANAKDITLTIDKDELFRGLLYLPFSGIDNVPKKWTFLGEDGNGIDGYGDFTSGGGIVRVFSVVTKVRFDFSSGDNFGGGNVYLYRRREFVSG